MACHDHLGAADFLERPTGKEGKAGKAPKRSTMTNRHQSPSGATISAELPGTAAVLSAFGIREYNPWRSAGAFLDGHPPEWSD